MGQSIASLVQSGICRDFEQANRFLWVDFHDVCSLWTKVAPPPFMSLAGLAGFRPPEEPLRVGKIVMPDGREVTPQIVDQLRQRASRARGR